MSKAIPRRCPKAVTTLALAGALAGTLGGCALNPDAGPESDTVPEHRLYHSLIRLQPPLIEPQVETVTMTYTVRFPDGEAKLDADELARLNAFLRDNNALEARVEIDGPRDAAGYHDGLTAARLEALNEVLYRFGISAVVPDRTQPSLTRPEDATVVTLTRAMVIEPDCSTPKTIYGPRPTHIWGCSSATILGRMVVDPLDLERGRQIGPADGEAAAQSIQRYREDKVKELKTESTN